MKLVIISDTHGQHWKLKIPKCDLFIFAGDANIDSLISVYDFNDWLSTIDAKLARICVFGNHDTEAERMGKNWCKQLLTNAIYLENELVEIEGLRIYGSPFSPKFYNWSFMYQRCSLEAKKIW